MKNLEKDQPNPFTAIVLAGDRGPHDPLSTAAGTPCKALVPVGGTPMILRVLEALGHSGAVGSILLRGPEPAHLELEPRLRLGIEAGRWIWHPAETSPSASAYAALVSLPHHAMALVTTADHALLRAEVVDSFCTAALSCGADLAVGLVEHERVMGAFPGVARTRLSFRGGAYCGCNLYAFLTPESREAARFWRQVEQDRKRPWRMVRKLGWVPLLAYLAGRLSLEETLGVLSRRLGILIRPVLLPFPEAAVDVDKPSDWELAERALQRRL